MKNEHPLLDAFCFYLSVKNNALTNQFMVYHDQQIYPYHVKN